MLLPSGMKTASPWSKKPVVIRWGGDSGTSGSTSHKCSNESRPLSSCSFWKSMRVMTVGVSAARFAASHARIWAFVPSGDPTTSPGDHWAIRAPSFSLVTCLASPPSVGMTQT